LDAELVAKGLLTRTELIDAIAVGQFTPGPVFSSLFGLSNQWNIRAFFYAGDILPSFVFVALLNPMVKKDEKL
jgi:chromate transporter